MTNDNLPFPDEISHLEIINHKLDAALQKADASVNKIDKEYMAAKRYMADYRGEIDPHEMFQNELALKQIDRSGAFAVSLWEKLVKLKESPYFARIDFQARDQEAAANYYIGRFTFNYENELLIFDWRAPVAGMFYDYTVGPAGYDAPLGRITGHLTRKRQFKIKNGIMEYALESSVNIGDEVLQRELSHTSDEKMKSIISTIQKEQNQIIRNKNATTVLIQGVAGSGKTSIALHRIAFLLYQFKDKLSAGNVLILSPNKVFGDYISSVLPELGEEPICELCFTDIAAVQLEGVVSFEPDKNPLEADDAKWAKRVRFKSTLSFVEQLEQYLQEVTPLIFEPEDYTFERFTVTGSWIKDRYRAYENYPVKKRLELISTDIYDRFETENFLNDDLPKKRVILKSLGMMLKVKNSLTLYKSFYKWLALPHMLALPARQTLEWADVYPFLYLHAAFEGLKESKLIKHLVIDEMQDYTPVQFAVINRLFPCQKTILGDFLQCINPNHQHTLADIQRLYPEATLTELNKSYRSTWEIITYAKTIGQVDKLEPVERHKDAPQLIPCKNSADEMANLQKRLDSFLKNENTSLGIILKTNRAAADLYRKLESDYKVRLISPDSTRFENGISITSIEMSKGLEFDEVIIPDASDETYHSEADRSLLYIAVTRAMHQLTLLYTEKPSPFLPT